MTTVNMPGSVRPPETASTTSCYPTTDSSCSDSGSDDSGSDDPGSDDDAPGLPLGRFQRTHPRQPGDELGMAADLLAVSRPAIAPRVTLGAMIAPPGVDAQAALQWRVGYSAQLTMPYWWHIETRQTVWIETPGIVQTNGFLTAGHMWVGQAVTRFFLAVGFVQGTITCWQPPTPDGDPPQWRMVHDDGDEEDLDEQEASDALALRQECATLPGLDLRMQQDVEVYWDEGAFTPGWYVGKIYEVTLESIVVVSPAHLCA
jgi:hypothetical protein